MAGGVHEETLRLEGFSESLRGYRTYIVASQPKAAELALRCRMTALDAEVAHRGRRVLLFQGGVPPKWLVGAHMSWDAVFALKDQQDLKLALTYLQHATKPVRAVWAGGEMGQGVLGALGRIEGLTLLGVGAKAPVASAEAWQAVFWAPGAAVEEVEPAVHAHLGHAGTTGLRPVLKELAASEVGLVWSSIRESDKRGALYWWDPAEGVDTKPHVDATEAAETLRAVADMLSGGGLGHL